MNPDDEIDYRQAKIRELMDLLCDTMNNFGMGEGEKDGKQHPEIDGLHLSALSNLLIIGSIAISEKKEAFFKKLERSYKQIDESLNKKG